jgi:hypothetical protein
MLAFKRSLWNSGVDSNICSESLGFNHFISMCSLHVIPLSKITLRYFT